MPKKMNFAPGMTSGGSLIDKNDSINRLTAEKIYKMEFVHREDIYPNDLNKRYEQTDLEGLRDNIIERGLYHNLVVIKDKDKMRLISGERRWRAISLMDEKTYLKLFPAGIPCKVTIGTGSVIDEEIDLISANSEARSRSIQDNLEDVRRLVELYQIKKDNGEIENIPTEISKRLGITERQVRKYINVNNLIPELAEALNKKQIAFEDANKFASLGTNEQMVLADILAEDGKISKEDYESIQLMQKQTEEKLNKATEDNELIKKEIAAKDEQIALLQKMLDESKGKSNEKNVEKVLKKAQNKKEELEKKIEAEPKLTRKELQYLRRKNKLIKALDAIDANVNFLDERYLDLSMETDLLVRFQLLTEKMNELSEK